MSIYDAVVGGKLRKKFGPITTARQPNMAQRDTFEGHLGNDPGPPRLNAWHCRTCQRPVPQDRATCPHCTKQGGGS